MTIPATSISSLLTHILGRSRSGSAIKRGRQRLSKLNACGPGLPHGTPHVTAATSQAELHPLQRIYAWSGCRKATVRRSTNETRSWPSFPPWSGTNGFHGYARDNIGQGPVAWELGSDNVLLERFKQAQSYWQKWEDKEFWPSLQSSQISQLEKVFGRHTKYYAIDGGKWPPKAMVRFAWEDRTVLVTVGVALRPQPNVEMATEKPDQFRRIELGAVLPGHWLEEAVQGFGSYISGQSNLPWNKYTWLGPGHTLPCDSWQ